MGDLQADELVSFISDRTHLEPDRVARILVAGVLELVKSTYEPSNSGMLSFAMMISKGGKRGIGKWIGTINGAAFKTEETQVTVWEVTQALLDFLSHNKSNQRQTLFSEGSGMGEP